MRIIKTLALFLLIIYGGILTVNGQGSHEYSLSTSTTDSRKLEDAGLADLFKNWVTNAGTLREWMYRVFEEGYLMANYELYPGDSIHTIVNFKLGDRFTWAHLDRGNLPDELLSKTGYKSGFFDQQIVNFKKISRLFEAVIRHSENTGYPFANISLIALNIVDTKISAEIDFDPGPYITFDSLELLNQNRIKPAFLAAFLKMRPGTPYDQRRIDKLSNLIGLLPYLSVRNTPVTYFANEQCSVFLDLKDEKASAFDGIIGFLPNENEKGRLLITGQVYLRLENLLRSGKRLELDWQKMNVESQQLDLAYDHPALFRMPIDLSFSFGLYKQDTTFLSRETGFTLLYNNNRGKIGINIKRDISRLLQKEPLIESGRPVFVDYNLNYYGLVYQYNSLDHQVFPTMGWRIMSNLSFGDKNILRNSNLDESVYDGLQQNGMQWQYTAWFEKYFRLKTRNVLLAKMSGGYMYGKQLFLNDLFRLGGLNSLRGFNERFFYASRYITGTLEYRYLFENESALLVFCDGAFLGYDLNNETYKDYPMGIGAGINISTKAGLLNVVYAVGRSNDQAFNIRYSKIHIGYTGRF